MKNLLIFSLLCLTSWCAAADELYFDETTGFAPLGGGASLLLESDSYPSKVHLLKLPDADIRELTLRVLLRNHRGAPDRQGSYTDSFGHRIHIRRPGMQFVVVNEAADTMRVWVKSAPLSAIDLGGREAFDVFVELPDTILYPDYGKSLREAAFHSGAPAQLSLHLNPGEMQLHADGAEPQSIGTISNSQPLTEFLSCGLQEAGFAAMPGGKIEVLRASLISPESYAHLDTSLDINSINTRLSTSTDPIEGYWQLLDYSTDDTLLLPGGNYVCAMIAIPSGGYRLIYYSGSQVNTPLWQPGMIKAVLRPRGLPGAFQAEWYDAEGESLDPNCSVQIDSPRVLTVQFPRLASTLRMHKIAAPERQ